MDEEELYQELKKRRIIRVVVTLLVITVLIIGGRSIIEWTLTSMGLQPAPKIEQTEEQEPEIETEEIPYGHVAVWTGESSGSAVDLPAYEVTVEDYRLAGLSHVGRPSATQEQLSADLFIVVNDDPGNLILETMNDAGIHPQKASTFSVLVRDNPTAKKPLALFAPVTVTITVPDDLVEDAFVDNLTVYTVYNKQYPDDPGGLVNLPVSASEEDGICYVSFLVREDYETEYALTTK